MQKPAAPASPHDPPDNCRCCDCWLLVKLPQPALPPAAAAARGAMDINMLLVSCSGAGVCGLL